MSISTQQLQQTEQILKQFLLKNPTHVKALRDLGRLYMSVQAFDKAETYYAQATRVAPTSWEGFFDHGNACLALGWSEAALASLQKANTLSPNNAMIMPQLGISLAQSGQFIEAENYLTKAWVSVPKNIGLLNNLANVLKENHKFSKAYKVIDIFLKGKKPIEAFWALFMNRGTIAIELGDFNQAISDLEQAEKMAPEHPLVLNNLGTLYWKQANHQQAEVFFKKALVVAPDYFEAKGNLANIYGEQGKIDQAIPLFDDVIKSNPEYAKAYINKALAYLMVSDYVEGFQQYHYRWGINGAGRPATNLPLWTGQDIKDKTLVLYDEQGLGDSLFLSQFIKYIPRSIKVKIIIDERLATIFQRNFPDHDIIPMLRDENRDISDISGDAIAAFGDLPAALKLSAKNIFAQPAYLSADPDKVKAWRKKYETAGPAPYIGLSWRDDAAIQEIPLVNWSNNLKENAATFINCQLGNVEDELMKLEQGAKIKISSWPNIGEDMDDYLAQISALDGMVSLCNVTAHMAGLTNTPTTCPAPMITSWQWPSKMDPPW